ncbi:hypothetical protein J6590_001562 [Homalodisca vitripennis]|nr:hypothetical protein J6590_001562 [Homalodisca vitripennis]
MTKQMYKDEVVYTQHNNKVRRVKHNLIITFSGIRRSQVDKLTKIRPHFFIKTTSQAGAQGIRGILTETVINGWGCVGRHGVGGGWCLSPGDKGDSDTTANTLLPRHSAMILYLLRLLPSNL